MINSLKMRCGFGRESRGFEHFNFVWNQTSECGWRWWSCSININSFTNMLCTLFSECETMFILTISKLHLIPWNATDCDNEVLRDFLLAHGRRYVNFKWCRCHYNDIYWKQNIECDQAIKTTKDINENSTKFVFEFFQYIYIYQQKYVKNNDKNLNVYTLSSLRFTEVPEFQSKRKDNGKKSRFISANSKRNSLEITQQYLVHASDCNKNKHIRIV